MVSHPPAAAESMPGLRHRKNTTAANKKQQSSNNNNKNNRDDSSSTTTTHTRVLPSPQHTKNNDEWDADADADAAKKQVQARRRQRMNKTSHPSESSEAIVAPPAVVARRKRLVAVMIGMTVAVLGAAAFLAIALRPTHATTSSSTGASSTSSNRPVQSPVVVPAPVDSEESTGAGVAPTPEPAAATPTTPVTTRFGSFQVLQRVPHSTNAFTQGLCLHNGTLYEGTGLYGQSVIQIVNLTTGQVLVQRRMASRYFGEGLAYYDDDDDDDATEEQASPRGGRLVQITWKEQTGFVYDAATLNVLRNFTYETSTTEGWGITARRRRRQHRSGIDSNSTTRVTTTTFLVTDGSSFLLTWDTNFTELRRIPVTLLRSTDVTARAIPRLNELEWDPFTDTVYANVWQQNVLLRINVNTGFVSMVYDLSDLYPSSERDVGADVLNGIAVTNESGVVWVTGKLWPYMYKIRLVDG